MVIDGRRIGMLRVGRWALAAGAVAMTACRGEVLLGGEQSDAGVDSGGTATSGAPDAAVGSSGTGVSGCTSVPAGSGSGRGAGTPVVLANVQAPAEIAVDGRFV